MQSTCDNDMIGPTLLRRVCLLSVYLIQQGRDHLTMQRGGNVDRKQGILNAL